MSVLRPAGAPPAVIGPSAAEVRAERASLAASVLDGRVFVAVTIPRTVPETKARMRLLTRSEQRAIHQETRRALRELGLEEAARSHSPEVFREWIEELATRTLAVAVRELGADVPLAPLSDWEDCDDDQIGALWERYKDLERELDPLSNLPNLSAAMQAAIVDAAKKKDARSLIAFGSSVLASFATTSVEPPAT